MWPHLKPFARSLTRTISRRTGPLRKSRQRFSEACWQQRREVRYHSVYARRMNVVIAPSQTCTVVAAHAGEHFNFPLHQAPRCKRRRQAALENYGGRAWRATISPTFRGRSIWAMTRRAPERLLPSLSARRASAAWIARARGRTTTRASRAQSPCPGSARRASMCRC